MTETTHASSPVVTRTYAIELELNERVVLVALFALVTLVGILTVTPWPVGVFQDDAIYTVVGKALAEGQGYRMINLPGEPHATRYPPAYPMVIALLWKFWPSFPDNIVLFKFVNAVFLGVTALATYAFTRARLAFSVVESLVVALLATLSVVMLLLTGVIMSEPMYVMVTMIALLRAERLVDEPTVRGALLVGLLLGLLALVRTVGAVAVPAAVLVLAWKRQWRAAFVVGAAASALIVPWIAWTKLYEHEIPGVFAGKYGSYGAWLSLEQGGLDFTLAVMRHNLAMIDGFLGYYFMPVTPRWPRAIAMATQLVLFTVGAIAMLRRAPVTVLYMGAYLTVVFMWPFEPTRFLLALWPPLMAALVLGALVLWRWRPGVLPMRALRWAAIAGVVAIVGGSGTYNWRGYTGKWWISIQREIGQRAAITAGWVARSTAMTDKLAIDHDLVVYLYTGRQSVPSSTFRPSEYLRPLDAAQHEQALREILGHYDVQWYATGAVPQLRAARALADADPPLLVRADSMPVAYIFKRVAGR
jgi:hypothetical protein